MRKLATVFFLVCLVPMVVAAKKKAMIISWGDVIVEPHQGVARLDTADKVREATKIWKYGRGSQSQEERKGLLKELERIPGVTGILHGYSSIMKAAETQ